MKFKALNIDHSLCDYLSKKGYEEMSPIQEQGIPVVLARKSAVLKAPTGSGKTFTYLVPILSDLDSTSNTEAVIILPTALLVKQLEDVLSDFQKGYKPFKVTSIVSGEVKEGNYEGKIIISTPEQFLFNRTKTNLKYLKRLVIDEGDMILFGGFEKELSEILSLDLKCAKYLFTASISEHLNTLVRKYIGADTLIDVTKNEINTSNITHCLVDIRHEDKFDALEVFLKAVKPYKAIVFCSKREDVDALDRKLNDDKIDHLTISGGLTQREQKQAYKAFSEGKSYLLIATDIAARGVDINDVTDVISLDLPYDLTYYFHRAGRSGRFFKKGTSYVFYNNDDTFKAKELIKKGVSFKFFTLKDGEMKPERVLAEKGKTQKKNNIYLEKAIKYRIRKLQKGKVKPNYKKKIKKAIAFVKLKHKDEVIRKNMERRNEKEGTNYAFVRSEPSYNRGRKKSNRSEGKKHR